MEILSLDMGRVLYHIPGAGAGTFSPDGKWFAYLAGDGKQQVYVTAVPIRADKWQVSADGATDLRWPVAETLMYLTSEGKMIGVAVGSKGSEFRVGKPEVEFGGRTFLGYADWDISHDGKRALVAVPTPATSARNIRLIQNWNGHPR